MKDKLTENLTTHLTATSEDTQKLSFRRVEAFILDNYGINIDTMDVLMNQDEPSPALEQIWFDEVTPYTASVIAVELVNYMWTFNQEELAALNWGGDYD